MTPKTIEYREFPVTSESAKPSTTRLTVKDSLGAGRWVFLGFERCFRSPEVDHKDFLIRALFGKLKPRIWPNDLRSDYFENYQEKLLLIPVNEMPRYQTGDIIVDGNVVASTPGETHFFRSIPLGDKCVKTHLGCISEDNSYYPLPWKRYNKVTKIGGSTVYRVKDVRSETGRTFVLYFPWWTIFKFFFASSQKLVGALFRGDHLPPNRIWDPSKSRWINESEGHYFVRLEKWMDDFDAFIVAHLAAFESYRKAAFALSDSLQGNFAQNPYPLCKFPINRLEQAELKCMPMGQHGEEIFLLVTEIISCDVNAALNPRINLVDAERDNPGSGVLQNPDSRPVERNHRQPNHRDQPNDEYTPSLEKVGDTNNPPTPASANDYPSPFATKGQSKIRIFRQIQETHVIHTSNEPNPPSSEGSTLDPGGRPGGSKRLILTPVTDASQKRGIDRLDSTINAIGRMVRLGEIEAHWHPLGTPDEGYDLRKFITAFSEWDKKDQLWVSSPKYPTRRCYVCECTTPDQIKHYVLEFEHRPTEALCVLIIKDLAFRDSDTFLPHILATMAKNKGVAGRVAETEISFSVTAKKHFSIKPDASLTLKKSLEISFTNRLREAMGLPMEKVPEKELDPFLAD